MTAYIIRRFLSMTVVLFFIALITFILMRIVPGGPFDRERPLPEQTIAQLNERYNLEDPLHVQFLSYLGNVAVPRFTSDDLERNVQTDFLVNIDLPGDSTFRWMNFGPSVRNRSQSVTDIIRDRLPVSATIGTAALLVAMAIGIPIGIIAGLNRNTIWDYISMGIAIIGVSLPVIVSGPILRYLFGVALRDTFLALPPTGWNWVEVAGGVLVPELRFLILPAFALGFSSSALLARLTRASLLQVLHEDYIRTARAKGLSSRRVILLHAMKNAMIPVVTVIGPLFAFLVTGSFVTELIFGLPGLGEFFVVSITNRDYPVIMGTTLLFAAVIVIANMVVDIVYAWLDPRIQYN